MLASLLPPASHSNSAPCCSCGCFLSVGQSAGSILVLQGNSKQASKHDQSGCCAMAPYLCQMWWQLHGGAQVACTNAPAAALLRRNMHLLAHITYYILQQLLQTAHLPEPVAAATALRPQPERLLATSSATLLRRSLNLQCCTVLLSDASVARD